MNYISGIIPSPVLLFLFQCCLGKMCYYLFESYIFSCLTVSNINSTWHLYSIKPRPLHCNYAMLGPVWHALVEVPHFLLLGLSLIFISCYIKIAHSIANHMITCDYLSKVLPSYHDLNATFFLNELRLTVSQVNQRGKQKFWKY